MNRKYSIALIIILMLFLTIDSYAQELTLDTKVMSTGKVVQWIPNNGAWWGLNTYVHPININCEYPIGSFVEHLGEGGIWVGGITENNDTLVSVTTSWAPWGLGEFWPCSNDPADSIWVVNQRDTVDIPWWKEYVGMSTKDYVFRYNDYNDYSMSGSIKGNTGHEPLYVEVIEIVHNWSAPDILAKVKMYEYYIISKRYDLEDVYISEWVDPNVGLTTVDFQPMLTDDYSRYFSDLKMGVGLDAPGGVDGHSDYPVGVKLFPPDNVSESSLWWTFKWGAEANPPGITPNTDREKYTDLMAARTIMEDQQVASGSHFIVSFGPMDLMKGDTLHFWAGLIFGDGLENLKHNAKALARLKKKDFKVPSAPPNPPLRAITEDKQVKLVWEPTEENNSEVYYDPNRADGDSLPFEGYRLYKSTKSASGPWKLLGEFDIKQDNIANDLGIQYEYIDKGLINNVKYYYTVTAFSKPDEELNWPSLESSKNDNAMTVVPGTAPPEKVGQVAVVPNPYRGDMDYNSYNPPWEKPPPSRNFWMEQDRRVQFINLPKQCIIKIYTSSGRLVNTIEHDALGTNIGYHDWNLTSSVGQAISSGIYLFTVENKKSGEVQVGKFVVIK